MTNRTPNRRSRTALVVGAAFVIASAAGCKKNDEQKAPAPAAKTAVKTPKTPKTKVEPAHKASASGIKWVHDDYVGALAAAKKANKPLVIDMWAPWCHTCLSMKHFVLVDAGLKAHADRFVWLAVDTDKEVNAAVLAQYPVSAWPTFFVVSPDESVQARQLGSSSVAQFRELLDHGERGHRAGGKPLTAGSPGAFLQAADQAAVKKDYAGAAKGYGDALAAAPVDWPRTADVLVSQISSLYKAGDKKACAELGLSRVQDTVPTATASTADFSYYASECGKELDKKKGAALRAKLLTAIDTVLKNPKAGLAVDDRSDALRIVRELHLAAGDEKKAMVAARSQQSTLDHAASRAPNAKAAMTYNWPRSEVYVHLGEGEKLVPALKKSMADLPDEYDPPYRLAWVLHKIEKHDDALAAANKALALAYGPRKGRVLSLIASIHKARGDKAAEKTTRETVLKHYESLPVGHKSERSIERAKKALADMQPS